MRVFFLSSTTLLFPHFKAIICVIYVERPCVTAPARSDTPPQSNIIHVWLVFWRQHPSKKGVESINRDKNTFAFACSRHKAYASMTSCRRGTKPHTRHNANSHVILAIRSADAKKPNAITNACAYKMSPRQCDEDDFLMRAFVAFHLETQGQKSPAYANEPKAGAEITILFFSGLIN